MESFNVDCSDDELKDHKGPWEPSPEEIDRLYSMLDKDELPEISWKCPGYRPPSPEITDEPEEEIEAMPYVCLYFIIFFLNNCFIEMTTKTILILWMKQHH